MMRLLLGFWLLATLSGTAALGTAADLTGKWSGTLSIAGENMPSYMSLMQDGPMIVGSMGHDETHQFPLRNVTVDQDTLAFEASTPKVTFSLSLKISEDSLKGTVKVRTTAKPGLARRPSIETIRHGREKSNMRLPFTCPRGCVNESW